MRFTFFLIQRARNENGKAVEALKSLIWNNVQINDELGEKENTKRAFKPNEMAQSTKVQIEYSQCHNNF